MTTISQDIDLSDYKKTADDGIVVDGLDDDSDIDINVVDDRAPDDRDKPLAHEMRTKLPDDELAPLADNASEDERETYARDARNRIKQLTAHNQAERRSREEAERQAAAAIELAQNYVKQTKEWQDRFKVNEQFAVPALKQAAERTVKSLTAQLKKAHAEGDTDAIVDISQQLQDENLKLAQLTTYQPVQVNAPDIERDWNEALPRQVARPAAPVVHEDTQQWIERNPWFNSQPKMKAYAMAVHEELTSAGVNPLTESQKYFKTIDEEMHQRFPDYPWRDKRGSAPPVNTASAARDTTPRKKGSVTLTRSEIEVARKMGVDPKAYAREKLRLRGDA